MNKQEIKKRILVGSIFAAFIIISMPFISAISPFQISETTEKTEKECGICPLNPSNEYCEGLSNFIESLKESRDNAYAENKMILYTIFFIMVKWNTVKYVLFCA